MTKRLLWLVGLTLLAGCATQPGGLYYWSDYTQSLYRLKKDPSPEHFSEHAETLREIITTSQEQGRRVPPGIHAELGYLYALNNETALAIEQFRLEQQVWPESTLLMERVIAPLAAAVPQTGGAR